MRTRKKNSSSNNNKNSQPYNFKLLAAISAFNQIIRWAGVLLISLKLHDLIICNMRRSDMREYLDFIIGHIIYSNARHDDAF